MTLSTTVDATYGDDPANPSQKQHQQDHDVIHGAVNDLPVTYAVNADTSDTDPVGNTLSKVGLVLQTGAGGTFDADYVESPCVFADPATGRLAMVYTGYGSDTGAQRASVGLAYSDDGVTWTKYGRIFQYSGTGGAPDQNGTTAPVVVYEAGTYYLFYCGLTATGYEAGTKTMCLATASSLTGTWTRQGAIISPSSAGTGWRSDAIYHASIVKRGATYYMFFNAYGVVGGVGAERIGYATASSLSGPWTPDDTNSPLLSPGSGWESGNTVGDPSVHRIGNAWRMDYYGVGTGGASDGYATCTDSTFPLTWSKYANNPILTIGASGSYDDQYAHKPYIMRRGGRVWHYYTAVNVSNARMIALAVDPGAWITTQQPIPELAAARTTTSTTLVSMDQSTYLFDAADKPGLQIRFHMRVNPGGTTVTVQDYVTGAILAMTGAAWANGSSPWVNVTQTGLYNSNLSWKSTSGATVSMGNFVYEFRWLAVA